MQSIGERLEEARKRKGVSIREASEATKIRGDFLLGFENNQFDIDLPEIYVRGFLRNYAVFLKLDADKIVTDFNAKLIGEVKASRKESRELFGRMEIPEKSRPKGNTGGSSEATPPAVTEPTAESTAPKASRFEMTPEMINSIKIGAIIVAGVIAILVIVWMIQAIVRMATAPSDSAPPATQTAPAQVEQQAPQEIITLIALDNVRVKVTQAADGKELFDGPLARGETRQVAKRGRVLITYDNGRNLNVEKDGRRFRMPIDGIGRSSFE